jgi:HK97 family phage major capsid protein
MTGTIAPDFVAQLRAELDARIQKRSDAVTALAAVTELPAAEKRGLNAAEEASFNEHRSTILALDITDPTDPGYADSIAAVQSRYNELAAIEARTFDIAARTPAPNVQVRKEQRTYGPASEAAGVSFLRDVAFAQLSNDFQASQRLGRHMQEEIVERAEYLGGVTGAEVRDASTSSFAGLVVPQYLVDLAAPILKNKRPFLDGACNPHPLPPQGMTLNLSRITTATTVTVQASENAAASETDIDDTLLTVNVRTYAGQQDMSRQAIERGAGTEQIMVQDLIGSYHSALDSGCLNDDGTSGTHLGVRNVSGNAAVTFTSGSPTAALLHPKLADLISQLSAGTDEGLTHFVMHPRRWWWLASQLGSTFPLITVGGAGMQQAGTLGGLGYEANGRNYLGAGIVLDRNLPTNLGAGTNEDPIVGVNAAECHLWEDANAPLLIRAEQTAAGNLTVKYVVYGYSAFTAGRYPLATGDITGTGLVTPAF